MQASDRARAYSRLKDRIALFSMAFSVLSSVVILFTGAGRRLNRALLPDARPVWWKRLRYTGILSALSWLAGLPVSVYSGYVVEKRYELSKQTPGGWAGDQIKGKAISTPLELAVVEGVYATIRRWPRRWWLVCAGAVIPLTAVLAQLFPVLIAPRFNKYEPLRDRDLAARLEDLTARAGVPVAGVMQMDMSRRTTKANAFFAGLGRSKRIVLADTMLDQFTAEEIEGVVAHEAAHQVNRDIWRFIGLSSVFTLVMAWSVDVVARRLMRAMPQLAGTSDLADPRSLPVIGFVMTLLGLALSPLQLAYSRLIERRADAYAVALTGNPAAYAGAMRKLAETNLADPDPPRVITVLLHSHPPIAERVARAEAAGRTG